VKLLLGVWIIVKSRVYLKINISILYGSASLEFSIVKSLRQRR